MGNCNSKQEKSVSKSSLYSLPANYQYPSEKAVANGDKDDFLAKLPSNLEQEPGLTEAIDARSLTEENPEQATALTIQSHLNLQAEGSVQVLEDNGPTNMNAALNISPDAPAEVTQRTSKSKNLADAIQDLSNMCSCDRDECCANSQLLLHAASIATEATSAVKQAEFRMAVTAVESIISATTIELKDRSLMQRDKIIATQKETIKIHVERIELKEQRRQELQDHLKEECERRKGIELERDLAHKELADIKKAIGDPSTPQGKRWEISQWQRDAQEVHAARAKEVIWTQKQIEIGRLETDRARLQPLADQAKALQTENVNLQTRLHAVKTSTKVEMERLRADNKNLKNSKEGQLARELTEAKGKNGGLTERIRQLETQLARSTPSAPSSPNLSLGEVGIHPFQQTSMPNRTYEHEAARVLDYLRDQWAEVARRANHIQDQDAGGWSAYEQLENVVAALARHTKEAVDGVFSLKKDLEREVKLNTMGFVVFDAAKKGKKK